MAILNYTPHEITVICGSGTALSIPSDGRAVVASTPGAALAPISTIGGSVQVYAPSTFGAIEGLPAAIDDGDVVVVSSIVGAAARERWDVLCAERGGPGHAFLTNEERVLYALVTPGTGPLDNPVRTNGQVVAVTRLIRVIG